MPNIIIYNTVSYGGATGKVLKVIEKFVQGKLEAGESFCKPGAGKGYGLEKEECDHSDTVNLALALAKDEGL